VRVFFSFQGRVGDRPVAHLLGKIKEAGFLTLWADDASCKRFSFHRLTVTISNSVSAILFDFPLDGFGRSRLIAECRDVARFCGVPARKIRVWLARNILIDFHDLLGEGSPLLGACCFRRSHTVIKLQKQCLANFQPVAIAVKVPVLTSISLMAGSTLLITVATGGLFFRMY